MLASKQVQQQPQAKAGTGKRDNISTSDNRRHSFGKRSSSSKNKNSQPS